MVATPYSDLLASIRRRTTRSRLFAGRCVPAIIFVDETTHRQTFREMPPAGTVIDVGYLVTVTSSKRVAGGGAIVYAERVRGEVKSLPPADAPANGISLLP
jgi:hypothetical protein